MMLIALGTYVMRIGNIQFTLTSDFDRSRRLKVSSQIGELTLNCGIVSYGGNKL